MAICPETSDLSAQTMAKYKLDFDILRDEGNEVAHAFGLRFRLPDEIQAIYADFGVRLPEMNGEDSQTLAMPARYVIDRDGIVRYARVHPDYTVRPEPAETVAAVRGL